MDWDQYWRGGGRDEASMREAGQRHVGRLEQFFDTLPPSLADVGCGTGELARTYAERHPEATVVGYDTSSVAIERAREARRRRGVDVQFEVETLPGFDPGRTFECVLCLSTLHYVEDGLDALSAMFEAVEPGGHLIFTYPSPATRALYREQADDPETGFPEDRFRKVLDGESVLTEDGIESTLGVSTHSFWHAVDDPDADEVAETLPCPVAAKPD